MSLHLATDDLARLDEASRLLLNPFAAAQPTTWLAGAGEVVRNLLGGDLTLVAVPTAAGYLFHSPESPSLAAAISALTREITADGLTFHDPVLTAWYARHRDDVSATWESNSHFVEQLGYRMEDSLFVDAGCRQNGMEDYASLHLPSPGGDATLLIMNSRRGRLRFGSDAPTLLRMLAPSFRVGVDALVRFQAPLLALDAVAEGLLVLDADGRERYRNAALVGLLDMDPERTAVDTALWQLGRDVRRLVFPRRHQTAGVPPPMQREVSTTRARYTLRASVVPVGAFGPAEAALVSVSATLHARPLTVEEVRARTGLTPREAEVALLAAEGLSNREIADRLFLAPGTVKRHLEGTFSKLGVSTRAAVAARLMRGE